MLNARLAYFACVLLIGCAELAVDRGQYRYLAPNTLPETFTKVPDLEAYDQGIRDFAMGRYPRAVLYFQQAAAARPENVNAWLGLVSTPT